MSHYNQTNNQLIDAVATEIVDKYKNADTEADIILFAAEALEKAEGIAHALTDYGVTVESLRNTISLKTTLVLARKTLIIK